VPKTPVLHNSDHSVYLQDIQKLMLIMHSIQTTISVIVVGNYITLI